MPDAVAVPTRVQRTGVLWFDSLRDCLARFPLSIIPLAGRVGVGSVFFKAGLSEVQLAGIHVPLLDPATAARIATAQELTIPILLFLGLATRVATLPLLGMILVIQTFVYPAGCVPGPGPSRLGARSSCWFSHEVQACSRSTILSSDWWSAALLRQRRLRERAPHPYGQRDSPQPADEKSRWPSRK